MISTLPYSERTKLSAPNFTGFRIKTWTVVKQIQKPDNFTRWWLCKCDCGEKCCVSSAGLGRNAIKRCHCDTTSIKKRDGTTAVYTRPYTGPTECLWCKVPLVIEDDYKGRARHYCGNVCKLKYYHKYKSRPYTEPMFELAEGLTKTCKVCEVELPIKSFRTVTSGWIRDKCYYINTCRICTYQERKFKIKDYYTQHKERDREKQRKWKKAWSERNKRRGKCDNCSTKLKFEASKCLQCYIHTWIEFTAYNLQKNKIANVPLDIIQLRKRTLHDQVCTIASMANQVYPHTKLGHVIPVRKNQNMALIMSNLEWSKSKPRKQNQNKDVQFMHIKN